MSHVLCLGGYGQFGLPTAQILVADPAIDRVIIAGRDLAKARSAAAELGPKASARLVDADDPDSLAAGMDGVHVVMSTLWSADGRAERVARAAVAAGAHYCDLNNDAQEPSVDAEARERGLTLLTRAGFSPGITNLMARTLLDAIEEPSTLVAIRHWTRVLDIWTDLFDAYIELPGGRKRGPLGRELHPTLTAEPRDPGRLAAVLRDACAVPFWVTIAGDPDRWTSAVPTLEGGRMVEVDPTARGLDVDLTTGARRRRPLLAATDGGADDAGVRRIGGSLTGMRPAFDEAVRSAARRIAEGADAEAEIEALEARVVDDLDGFVPPPSDIAELPTMQFLAYGGTGGDLSRGSLVMNDALFAPAWFLQLTAAALAVTVRYLLDGTIRTGGAMGMDEAVADVDRFAADYLELLPEVPAGTPLFTMRVDPA